MRSRTHEPHILRLKKCWLSYDAASLGNEIAVSLGKGEPNDKMGFPPRGDLESWINLVGQGILPDESGGKDVWITLQLSIDETVLVLRNSTHVRSRM
jgi:hypothetical protein